MASGDTFAGYRIEEVAGRGPLGVVYRATQLSLSRTVALKLIDADAPADVRERFRGAARVLAALDHPYIVRIYEAGEADGQLFVARRWVTGADLGTLLAREGALGPARAARVVSQVA